MSNDFVTKYPFTEEEFNEAFNRIWDGYKSRVSLEENKKAFVLGGQPGAAKSSLIKEISNNKLNNNAIIISGDDYRRYHPKFDEIQKNETTFSAKYTQAFSSKITENLIKKASDKGYNLIIEGTFRTEQTPIKTLELLKNKGYDTNIAIKVCNKDVSWNSCLERYEKQKEINPQTARYTKKEDHDIVIENLSNNAAKVFEKGLANKIYIRNREEEILNLDYDKNLIEQNSNLIKNTINKELNFNQKEQQMETKNLENANDNLLSIKITDLDNLNPNFKKILEDGVIGKDFKDKTFKNEDAKFLIRTFETYDKTIKEKELRDSKFLNESIGLEVETASGKKYPLNIKFGEESFSKDLSHLISSGSKDLNRTEPKADEKINYKEVIEKDDNGKYKNKLDIDKFDNLIVGSSKSMEVLAQATGDETMIQFAKSFSASMGVFTGNIKPKEQQTKNQNLEKETKKLLEKVNTAITSGQIKLTGENKEKNRFKHKTDLSK